MATYIADERIPLYREAVYMLSATFYRMCRFGLYPQARACQRKAAKLAAIAEIDCPKMWDAWVW